MSRHTLSVLVQDQPGVLARVARTRRADNHFGIGKKAHLLSERELSRIDQSKTMLAENAFDFRCIYELAYRRFTLNIDSF